MPIKFTNSAAHEPFYDTPVKFYGPRVDRRVFTTVMACVFENGFDGPLLDENVDSTRKTVGIAFPTCSWLHGDVPQIGEVASVGNTDYRVFKVEESLGDYHLSAREVE